MPLTHTVTFPVRYDECDMYGHVNHASYLRYMQEAAFRASAAAGYDVARYLTMERVWFVRQHNVEYLQPLRYGDSVRVKTWVRDFRRVRSHRLYEIQRAEDGELVARASTDWIYLDQRSGCPISVPAEIVASFLPEGNPARAVRRERFPQQPAPPPGVFREERRVEWADIDPAGHVNNAVYLSYLEDCAIQDALSRGWSMSRMLEEGQFAIVARRYRIEYLQPAHLNEQLELATWISDVRRVSAVRHYTVRRCQEGTLLARAWALWAWVDPQTGRPVRIPEDFLDDFADNVVDSES